MIAKGLSVITAHTFLYKDSFFNAPGHSLILDGLVYKKRPNGIAKSFFCCTTTQSKMME